MRVLKKIGKVIIVLFIGLYIAICGLVYFNQEGIIFFPEKLPESHLFTFDSNFEEKYINVSNDIAIHGVLFKSDTSKGLIFYLHGNGGSVRTWGEISKTYTDLGYDLFILDYRGYGMSAGDINSEETFFNDIQLAYDSITTGYDNKQKIILGYSIGTGSASWLGSKNDPDLLILQAPYYSLIDMKNKLFPFIPDFILKYKFETYKYLKEVKSPVVIFHGDHDKVIPYQSSIELKKHFKQDDELISLKNQGHNGMSYNPNYISVLESYLSSHKK